MTIPGLIWMPSSYTATWLHSRLSAIFGAALVGLWIGEDLVVDGSSNATSWPGRVGPTLASRTLKFGVSSAGGRACIQNSSTADVISLYGTLGTAGVDWFAVANPSTLPFAGYRAAITTTGTIGLTGDQSTSNWYDRPGSEYVNGFLTRAVTTSVAVHELTAATGTSVEVGGDTTTGASRNWIGRIFLACAVSANATPAQRILATAALKRYYGLAITPQESLAEALATIYGAALVGLWIGDDLVVSGSDVTSWPGRAGGNLAPIVAGTYRTRVSSGGRYYTTSPTNTRAGLQLASSDVVKSWVVAAEIPTLPFGALYPGLAASVADNHSISGNASSSDLYTGSGWSHKINGVSGESLSGLAGQTVVVSGEKPTEANAGFRLGCHGSNAWPWATKVGAAVALNAVHSAGQLPTSIAALKAYYSIP